MELVLASGTLKKFFLKVNKHGAYRIIKSLSAQLVDDDPNRHRDEFYPVLQDINPKSVAKQIQSAENTPKEQVYFTIMVTEKG
jgi:hypothetical protein